jgi:hypothetical protein
MIKRIKVKERMTGRELASMLSRSHLKWNNNAVIQREKDGRMSYCMIGQIAKHAGVKDETLQRKGVGNAPIVIAEMNDSNKTKAECVETFCNYRGEFRVKDWIDEMLQWQKDRVD